MRLTLTLLAAGLAIHGADPRLRIQPAYPKPGSSIAVIYTPKGGPIENATGFTLLYGFSAWTSERTPLQSRQGRFVAEIEAPADAVYFWCKVEGANAEAVDSNRGGVWDTYMYDNNTMPLEGARRTRAEMYMISQQPLEKNITRLILLEEELRAHPASAIAWGQWWGLRYEDSGQAIGVRDEILGEMARLLEAKRDQPWAYRAVSLGYNLLGRNAEGTDVLRDFIRRFPADSSLDDQILMFFGNWGTAADIESLRQLSNRWAAKPSYWSNLLAAYVRDKSDPSRIAHAGKQWLESVPAEKDTGGRVRSQVAEMWLSSGVNPADVEAVAREAVAISELGPRPQVLAVSPVAKKLARGMFVDIHRSTLGWALHHQHRYDAALGELQRAVVIRDKERVNTRALFYRLGQTLEKLGRDADAMDAYFKELAWGGLEKATRQAIASLYLKLNGSIEGMDGAVRERLNDLLAAKAAESGLWIDDVREKLGRFELRGNDGKTVPIERYRGKVVLIEFWATWCPSCLKSMEHSAALRKQFNDDLVVLAVSQDGEETRSKAVEYLRQKKYDFILLFDEIGRRELEVPFVPARVLLDRDGVVRVREYSWSPAQELVFETRLKGLLK